MTVRWAIVGPGEVAERNVAPAMAAAIGTELVAVYGRSREKAEAFATKFNVARAYGSLAAMLADTEIDAVYIATPNSLHAEQAIAAAQAGKHVLCDKPMSLTVEEGERMIAACAHHNVKLGVVFQNRYHPAHVEARRQIRAGVLGEIQTAHAQLCVGRARGHWKGWRLDAQTAGSGAIVGRALHPIDLLRFLMDSEVVQVSCMTDQNPPERPVDDMCWCLLRFANGAHATVVAGTLVPRTDNDVTVEGSKGKIVSRGTLGTQRLGTMQDITVRSDTADLHLEFPSDTSQMRFSRLLEDFNAAIVDQRLSHISGSNGLQLVKIANALLESSRSGQTIKIS